MQGLFLHQKLREEIKKQSTVRVRYPDSVLHFKNQELSRKSNNTVDNNNRLRLIGQDETIHSLETISKKNHGLEQSSKSDETNEKISGEPSHHQLGDPNCQVCFIKEVKQNLIKINKYVQERNEQMIRDKDKRLKSYFQKQMTD